jgi:hypothetical protein
MVAWRLLAADCYRYTFIVMSTYCFYQAYPERSRLLERLRTEQPLCLMYTCLINEPNVPFVALRLPELHEQYLEIFVHFRYSDSEEVAARIRDDLFEEMNSLLRDSPGIDKRSGGIRLNDELDELLQASFRELRHPDPVAMTNWVTMGRDDFVPFQIAAEERNLRLNPVSLVQEVAGYLDRFDPKQFEIVSEDFEPLRRTYLESAQRNEVILYS